MVEIKDGKLHTIVVGNGQPTVILDAGMGGNSLDWSLIQPEIAKQTKVLSYDRKGYGWSRATSKTATCENHVQDIRDLLKELKLNPPYLLVGHSFSGLTMRLFAATYPEETAGLILVDSVHEHYYLPEKMSEQRKRSYRKALKLNRLGYMISPLGLQRLIKLHVGSKNLPLEYQKAAQALGYQSSAFKSVYLELLFAEESARKVIAAGKIPDKIPITIISAGKQSEEWHEQQKSLTELNKNTKQIISENSWHAVQIYDPNTVITAINEMLQKIKQNRRIG